jgi:hypothetical protein
MRGSEKLYEKLDELGITYEYHEHEPARMAWFTSPLSVLAGSFSPSARNSSMVT